MVGRFPGSTSDPRGSELMGRDITDIRTSAGWRYLAVSPREVRWLGLHNLFSRRDVDGKLNPRMETALVIAARNRAVGHREVKPGRLRVYTDQGVSTEPATTSIRSRSARSTTACPPRAAAG